MKRFAHRWTAWLVCAACVMALATWAHAEEKKVVLKVPTAFSTNLPTLGDSLLFFKDYVEKASGGSIEVKIFEPGKLIPPFEILDAVSSGKPESVDSGVV